MENIVDTILGQVGGLLDVAGADISGGISLTASQGDGAGVIGCGWKKSPGRPRV